MDAVSGPPYPPKAKARRYWVDEKHQDTKRSRSCTPTNLTQMGLLRKATRSTRQPDATSWRRAVRTCSTKTSYVIQDGEIIDCGQLGRPDGRPPLVRR